jgi:hypothetical protein
MHIIGGPADHVRAATILLSSRIRYGFAAGPIPVMKSKAPARVETFR